MTLLADTETSCDPNMAALLTLIDRFLLENEVGPDLHNMTEEDVELWVKKSAELDVSAPLRSLRGKTDIGRHRLSW